jgi:hypothetical protein
MAREGITIGLAQCRGVVVLADYQVRQLHPVHLVERLVGFLVSDVYASYQ